MSLDIKTRPSHATQGGLPEDLKLALEEILEASIAITAADFGNVQMLSADGEALEIAVQRGFEKEFLDHFRRVPLAHGSSACGQAAEAGARIMIKDVQIDPTFVEHREIAKNAGFRAVQSTPLFSLDGTLLGMLSTHFKKPHLPHEKYLHMLDLYALQAAHVIELMRGKAVLADDPPVASLTPSHPPPIVEAEAKLSLRTLDALLFFADLTSKEKTELLQAARFKHFKRGEMIYHVGDLVTHLSWVCAGVVQKYRETPDGREMTNAIRITGDVLFDHEVVQGKRIRTTNAKALQNTTLLAVPVEWIDTHLRSWDHLVNKIMQLLAENAQASQIETEHQATFNAAQIVACFLQDLCVRHHFDPRGFTLPYTKSIIASRLGMELESLSRALPKLRDYGIIVRGKQVSFTNVASAQQFSCGHCSVAEECPTSKAMRELATDAAPPPKRLEVAD